MKTQILTLTAIGCVLAVFAACSSTAPQLPGKGAMAREPAQESKPDRMLVWSGSLSIQAWNVSNAVASAVKTIEDCGGYAERQSDSGEDAARLRLRIPVKVFKTTAGLLENLGTVTYRNIEAEDVTEKYIDVDARLKSKIALRDRLKQLLEKAADVRDVLAIETELNRVQADIDSMDGRLKAMKGQIDYATLELTIERKHVLGPVGYAVGSVFWLIGKLFVLW
jgi:hypothetical protein